MNQQNELIESFGTTNWLVEKFGEGLSHEDSIAVPSFRANSFNWVLGHILVGRDRVLSLLNQEAVLTVEEKMLYETGSEQLSAQKAVELGRLFESIAVSQERIAKGLLSASDEMMMAAYDEERQQTVYDRIKGLHWHETYHLGQLEILRQVNREKDAFP